MAYLDAANFEEKTRPEVIWEAMAAQLDLGRNRLPQVSLDKLDEGHVHYVQQMLLAAAVAGGGIIAIAGIMVLRLL
jgi:hypothetical protein